MSIHGWEIVEEARKWLGVPYKFGAEVVSENDMPFGDPYKKGWDCSEFIEFLLVKLGYKALTGEHFPDGSYNQLAYCKSKATLISIEKAHSTPGALIFLRGGTSGQISHVALTSGQNTTIEARGKDFGTGEWPWRDSRWSEAALIPGVTYSKSV